MTDFRSYPVGLFAACVHSSIIISTEREKEKQRERKKTSRAIVHFFQRWRSVMLLRKCALLDYDRTIISKEENLRS